MYVKHTYSSLTHEHIHTLTPHSQSHTIHRPGLGLQSLGHRVNTSQLPKQLGRRQETQYLPHDCQSDVPHTEKVVYALFLDFAYRFHRTDHAVLRLKIFSQYYDGGLSQNYIFSNENMIHFCTCIFCIFNSAGLMFGTFDSFLF